HEGARRDVIRFKRLACRADMRRLLRVAVTCLLIVLVARSLRAQQPTVPESTVADHHEIVGEKNHHYIGKVELERGDTKIYADEAWFYGDENRFVATGNVVFSQGANRVAAERVEL